MTGSNSKSLDISNQGRILSIDAFRFVAILMMVFFRIVHDGSFFVTDLPTWMWHAKPAVGITIVDTGCPFYIFIIGLCIPIAINRRLSKNSSKIKLLFRIFTRSACMMIMGILMGNFWENHEIANPIGISPSAWGVLLFISFFIIWNKYPVSKGFKRKVFIALRVGGIALLIYLVAVFRIQRGQELTWLEFGTWGFWMWGVLGIIGWSYLVSCIGHILFRKHIEGVVAFLGLHILIYIGDATGVFENYHFLDGIRHYVPFYALLGTWSAISTAGVIVGMLFLEDSPAQTPKKRIQWILMFGAGLFIAGFLLKPLFGISSGEGKVTPTWALYCMTMSCVIFAFFYWILDVKGKQRGIKFIMPVATNSLQTYLLTSLIHPLFTLLGIDFINNYFNSGTTGILRTVVYSVLLILFSSWLVTRCRIRLQI